MKYLIFTAFILTGCFTEPEKKHRIRYRYPSSVEARIEYCSDTYKVANHVTMWNEYVNLSPGDEYCIYTYRLNPKNNLGMRVQVYIDDSLVAEEYGNDPYIMGVVSN